MPILTVQEVREYISDYTPQNYLLDGEEMSDTFLSVCMSLGLDGFNGMAPASGFTIDTMPSKAILLWATLYHAFLGKAALLIRNTMSYTDGGLQIPIEERSELYRGLATDFLNLYQPEAQRLKIQLNLQSGWGCVTSDERMFPIW